VELLIDCVVVTDERVEIRYIIPTGPAGEGVPFCHLRLDYLYLPAPRIGGGLHPIYRTTDDGCFSLAL
jgi:hypothetical protein